MSSRKLELYNPLEERLKAQGAKPLESEPVPREIAEKYGVSSLEELDKLITSSKPKETKLERLSLRVTENVKNQIQQRAKGEGKSVNAVINDAILMYLQD